MSEDDELIKKALNRFLQEYDNKEKMRVNKTSQKVTYKRDTTLKAGEISKDDDSKSFNYPKMSKVMGKEGSYRKTGTVDARTINQVSMGFVKEIPETLLAKEDNTKELLRKTLIEVNTSYGLDEAIRVIAYDNKLYERFTESKIGTLVLAIGGDRDDTQLNILDPEKGSKTNIVNNFVTNIKTKRVDALCDELSLKTEDMTPKEIATFCISELSKIQSQANKVSPMPLEYQNVKNATQKFFVEQMGDDNVKKAILDMDINPIATMLDKITSNRKNFGSIENKNETKLVSELTVLVSANYLTKEANHIKESGQVVDSKTIESVSKGLVELVGHAVGEENKKEFENISKEITKNVLSKEGKLSAWEVFKENCSELKNKLQNFFSGKTTTKEQKLEEKLDKILQGHDNLKELIKSNMKIATPNEKATNSPTQTPNTKSHDQGQGR